MAELEMSELEINMSTLEIQESESEERIVEITATCIKYITFKIPEGLNLLSAEESEACDCKKPFSWWIRREKLYYLDAKGKRKTLELHDECTNKFPDGYDIKYEGDL